MFSPFLVQKKDSSSMLEIRVLLGDKKWISEFEWPLEQLLGVLAVSLFDVSTFFEAAF